MTITIPAWALVVPLALLTLVVWYFALMGLWQGFDHWMVERELRRRERSAPE